MPHNFNESEPEIGLRPSFEQYRGDATGIHIGRIAQLLLLVFASLAYFGGGIYLLSFHSASVTDGSQTWFEVIAKGIGLYSIGRGFSTVSRFFDR